MFVVKNPQQCMQQNLCQHKQERMTVYLTLLAAQPLAFPSISTTSSSAPARRHAPATRPEVFMMEMKQFRCFKAGLRTRWSQQDLHHVQLISQQQIHGVFIAAAINVCSEGMGRNSLIGTEFMQGIRHWVVDYL